MAMFAGSTLVAFPVLKPGTRFRQVGMDCRHIEDTGGVGVLFKEGSDQ
jgi:hypothetical protein